MTTDLLVTADVIVSQTTRIAPLQYSPRYAKDIPPSITTFCTGDKLGRIVAVLFLKILPQMKLIYLSAKASESDVSDVTG